MLIYGHRGARGEAPENTLAGFRRALDAGIRRVELDLRLSRDGVLVVMHDETVNRTTGARGLVSHLSVAELAALDARHNTPPWPDPQPVPTIMQVLEGFPQFLHLQLEVKPVDTNERSLMAERLLALFDAFELRSRATVTSFDHEFLATLRKLGPHIPLGLVADRARPEPLQIAVRLGAHMLVLHRKLCLRRRVTAAQRAGLHVSAWTVNDDATALQLQRLGVDSIITDHPSRIAALLRSPEHSPDQRGTAPPAS